MLRNALMTPTAAHAASLPDRPSTWPAALGWQLAAGDAISNTRVRAVLFGDRGCGGPWVGQKLAPRFTNARRSAGGGVSDAHCIG